MSKGSNSRPFSVSSEQFANSWEATFCKKKEIETKCKPIHVGTCVKHTNPTLPENLGSADSIVMAPAHSDDFLILDNYDDAVDGQLSMIALGGRVLGQPDENEIIIKVGSVGIYKPQHHHSEYGNKHFEVMEDCSSHGKDLVVCFSQFAHSPIVRILLKKRPLQKTHYTKSLIYKNELF